MNFFSQTVCSSNLAYNATVKPSAENIGIKIYVLPPTQWLFTVVVLTTLQWILQQRFILFTLKYYSPYL